MRMMNFSRAKWTALGHSAGLWQSRNLNQSLDDYRITTDKTIHSIVTALKKGFFSGEYGCEFPFIQIADDENNIVKINLDTYIFNGRLSKTEKLTYKWFGTDGKRPER